MLPYPQDPAAPSAPNPYFQDNNFVRGDQSRAWSAQAWDNMLDLDSRLDTAEGAISTAQTDIATLEVDVAALQLKRTFDPGHLEGITISNAVSDPTDDIAFAAGTARDDSDSVNMTAPAYTKQLNALFVAGNNQGMLDTGSVGNNTYHLWLIGKDNGTENAANVDYVASLSASNPSLPPGYVYKRYLWPMLRSSGQNVQFTQRGRRFDLTTTVLYSTGANPGTARVTAVLSSIPTGIPLIAIVQAGLDGATVNTIMTLRPLTETDAAPSYTAAPFFDVQSYNIGNVVFSGEMQVPTDSSAQVAIRLNHAPGILLGQKGLVLQKGWIVP